MHIGALASRLTRGSKRFSRQGPPASSKQRSKIRSLKASNSHINDGVQSLKALLQNLFAGGSVPKLTCAGLVLGSLCLALEAAEATLTPPCMRYNQAISVASHSPRPQKGIRTRNGRGLPMRVERSNAPSLSHNGPLFATTANLLVPSLQTGLAVPGQPVFTNGFSS